MADEKQPFSRNVTSLDIQAKELGIGGKLSPESDESLYKKKKNLKFLNLYNQS